MSARPSFGLDCTTIIKAGPACRMQVPKTLAGLGCSRVAIITDKGLVNAGVIDMVKQAFEDSGVAIAGIFDRVRQDNDTRDINECAQWYKDIGADGILGVGGGSVLDAAKTIKLLVGSGESDITSLIGPSGIATFARPKAKPLGIPHISMPTTAGTGAEVSQGTAIFHAETRKKLIVFHHYQNSDFAFLDPELTVSLPVHLTAEPAFDALVHCFEGFFSPLHNSYADALALRSARLILDNLPIAVEDGGNLDARGELQVASSMSVIASVSGRGAAPIHNFADAVGPAFGVSHGRANAVYAPIVMRNLPEHYLKRIREFSLGIGLQIGSKSDAELLDDMIETVEALQRTCSVDPRLDIDVDAEKFEHLIAEVKTDPAGLQYPLPDDVIKKCLKDSLNIVA